MKLIMVIFLFSTLAFADQIICEQIDEYGFNVQALMAEINESETEAVVYLQKEPGADFLMFPYNKKIVMKFAIGGEDGRWFQNDYDYPGEDYQFFLSTEKTKVRFWVDIWTNNFFGFASIDSGSCNIL